MPSLALTRLLRPIQIGDVALPCPVFYAPLAGCSDFPFRKMAARYAPGLMYCEMVKMEPLVRGDVKTAHYLDYCAEMHPIGAQICGSNRLIAAEAARRIEERGFDVIDLNCGCPVDKVTKDGSGSAMLKNLALMGEILAEMVGAVRIPVTVKIRAGWDSNQIVVEEAVRIAEEAGAQAICVHGRTRAQGYSGPANWDYIRRAKQAARSIKVIGNGDVVDGPSAQRMLEETHCDAVLIGRGTLGAPWIVQEILDFARGVQPPEKSVEECRQALYEHFQEARRHHPAHRICLEMRRVGCWYFKRSAGTKRFRELISHATSLEEMEQLILTFPIGEWGHVQRTEEEQGECCG